MTEMHLWKKPESAFPPRPEIDWSRPVITMDPEFFDEDGVKLDPSVVMLFDDGDVGTHDQIFHRKGGCYAYARGAVVDPDVFGYLVDGRRFIAREAVVTRARDGELKFRNFERQS